MGKKIYTGFSSAQEKSMRSIVKDASSALTKAYAVHSKTDDNDLFSIWFGTGARASVKAVLKAMNAGMKDGTVTINYTALGGCAGGNTNAIAYQPAIGWQVANIQQARNVDFTLDICPRLLKIMATAGTENQSQVGTLLHEISHLLGGTNDEADPGTGVVAYGAAAAKALATNHPALAVNNAENYGFYISAFLTA